MSEEIYRGSVERTVNDNKCPNCQRSAEGGTAVSDEGPIYKVEPGDFAICLYCGALNVYDERLMLRPPTRAEERSVKTNPRTARLLDLATEYAAKRRREWQ